jgi:hypothetical protein
MFASLHNLCPHLKNKKPLRDIYHTIIPDGVNSFFVEVFVLSLSPLESLACSFLPVFLTLLHSRVTGKKFVFS